MTAAHPVAVVQPLPGIGDMVWHVPALHALAAHHGPILLLARPRSRARDLLAADPAVAAVEYLGEDRGAFGKIQGMLRLARLLHRHRVRRVYVLHHSDRYAVAAMLAGVAERYGYGIGRQTRWLNAGPMLGDAHRNTFPVDKSRLFLEAVGIPVPEREPRLLAAATAHDRIAAEFADRPRPWLTIGVGASEPWKRWPVESFQALVDGLGAPASRTLFILGGPDEGELVRAIAGGRPGVVPVSHLSLDLVLALLARSAFFVGNDSGLLNLAASVGTKAFGLFGATPPLAYTARLQAILPPDGRTGRDDGMARITPEQVLDALRPALDAALRTTS